MVGFVLTVIANFYTVCDNMAVKKRKRHARVYDLKWILLPLEYVFKRKGNSVAVTQFK